MEDDRPQVSVEGAETLLIRQVTKDGPAVQGPFTVDRVRDWVAQGRVKGDMSVSVDGTSWVQVMDVPTLQSPRGADSGEVAEPELADRGGGIDKRILWIGGVIVLVVGLATLIGGNDSGNQVSAPFLGTWKNFASSLGGEYFTIDPDGAWSSRGGVGGRTMKGVWAQRMRDDQILLAVTELNGEAPPAGPHGEGLQYMFQIDGAALYVSRYERGGWQFGVAELRRP